MRLVMILIFVGSKLLTSDISVADKIISFAVQKIGKKVDRGECWDLANAALNYAGAQWEPPWNFGDKIDYKTQALKPADILQFTNVKFVFPFGTASFPKHTAIIYKINKKQLTLLHQNFNNKRFVDTLTIDLDNIKNGKIEAYRPKAKV